MDIVRLSLWWTCQQQARPSQLQAQGFADHRSVLRGLERKKEENTKCPLGDNERHEGRQRERTEPRKSKEHTRPLHISDSFVPAARALGTEGKKRRRGRNSNYCGKKKKEKDGLPVESL